MAKAAKKASGRKMAPNQTLMMSVNKGMGEAYKTLAAEMTEEALASVLEAIGKNLREAMKGLGGKAKGGGKKETPAAKGGKKPAKKKAAAKKPAGKKSGGKKAAAKKDAAE